jgi:hypothetical protein
MRADRADDQAHGAKPTAVAFDVAELAGWAAPP